MKKTLLFFLLLKLPFLLSAQDKNTGSGSRFSLQEAISYALEHQPTVLNATLEEKVAKQQVNEIVGLGTPQINGTAEINDFIEIPTSFVPGEFFGGEPGSYFPVQFGQQYTASVGLSVSQLIFDGSYLVGLKASRTFQELSRKQNKQTRIDAAINVSKAYYGALVFDQREAIIGANMQRVEKVMNDTRELYRNGFAEKLDVDRIELTYNNLLVERDKVERFKTIAYALLKFQMGLDPKAEIILTDKLETIKLEETTLAETTDVTKRPEYAVVQVQRQMQELDMKRYRSQHYPSLVGYGNLSTNASRNEFSIFDTDERWFPTAIIGIRLNVPIWDGLQRSSRVNMAKLKLQQVDNNLINLRNSLEVDYTNALTNYKNYKASLETTKRNRDLANEIARMSKVKYDNGVGSSLELIDAESSLREADANYFNTLYEAIIAKIELDKASGTLTY